LQFGPGKRGRCPCREGEKKLTKDRGGGLLIPIQENNHQQETTALDERKGGGGIHHRGEGPHAGKTKKLILNQGENQGGGGEGALPAPLRGEEGTKTGGGNTLLGLPSHNE